MISTRVQPADCGNVDAIKKEEVSPKIEPTLRTTRVQPTVCGDVGVLPVKKEEVSSILWPMAKYLLPKYLQLLHLQAISVKYS